MSNSKLTRLLDACDHTEELLRELPTLNGLVGLAVLEEFAEALRELKADIGPDYDRLTKPAQIGNTIYNAGCKSQLVIERAQRQYEFSRDLNVTKKEAH